MWNVILSKVVDNKIVNSLNMPTTSGIYLCTCVDMWQGEERSRYLHVMEYNAEKNYWHDCGNPSGISHNILAWTDEILPCFFNDYDYEIGGYFIER